MNPTTGDRLPDPERQRLAEKARETFSASLANDTKWNELLVFMRALDDWQPSYRWKSVNGYVSGWDVEWEAHVPRHFVGVEWFDIGLHEHTHMGRLLPPEIVDHTPEIVAVLDTIGFAYEVRGDVARIWGYSPMSVEDFPPA